MADFLQTIFSNACSWMKLFITSLRCVSDGPTDTKPIALTYQMHYDFNRRIVRRFYLNRGASMSAANVYFLLPVEWYPLYAYNLDAFNDFMHVTNKIDHVTLLQKPIAAYIENVIRCIGWINIWHWFYRRLLKKKIGSFFVCLFAEV